MVESDAVIILTTFPDVETARQAVQALVQMRLAACGQISSEVTSIFRWGTKIQEAPEVRVSLKTTRAAANALEAELHKRHPYEVPEFLMIEATAASKAYQEWLDEETYTGLHVV